MAFHGDHGHSIYSMYTFLKNTAHPYLHSVFFLAIILSGILIVYVSRLWEAGAVQMLFVTIFFLWGTLPYWLLHKIFGRKSAPLSRFSILGALLIVGFAITAYYSGFVVHPDPQNGILFIIVPVFQLVGITVLGVAEYIRQKRKAATKDTHKSVL